MEPARRLPLSEGSQNMLQSAAVAMPTLAMPESGPETDRGAMPVAVVVSLGASVSAYYSPPTPIQTSRPPVSPSGQKLLSIPSSVVNGLAVPTKRPKGEEVMLRPP